MRPVNSFWYWSEKPIMERGAALQILETAGLHVNGLKSRQSGQDPPDCEALINGRWSGIEITELVHRPTLERSLKTARSYFNWEQSDFLAALQALVDRKDRPENVKGGPYASYVLVIFTDEFFLDRETVDRLLQGATFHATMITDALLGLSYDPNVGHCPVFRLQLTKPTL